jgi:membrane protease subunit (stomatin/prohibitin family)
MTCAINGCNRSIHMKKGPPRRAFCLSRGGTATAPARNGYCTAVRRRHACAGDPNGPGTVGLAHPRPVLIFPRVAATAAVTGYTGCNERTSDMALMDFIKKQFIDVIEWMEDDAGTLAWRYPMEDREIQTGAQLTVRESQMAVFVNEGQIADTFGPGRHKLTTQTLPLLTNLKNWDKLFASPFKSDVYFFSTRLQTDQRWGTTQPVAIRDKDFGAVRLRAFGNYAYRLQDAATFHKQLSGTQARYTVEQLDGQLRASMVQHISDAVASSSIAFLDLAANQVEFARLLKEAVAPDFAALGLAVETVTVQSVSLPEELQKVLDQRIGMGMVGNDMGKFMQYQTGQAIPEMAKNAGGGGIAGDAMGLGAGVAMGQVLAQNLQAGLQGAAAGGVAGAAAGAASAAAGIRPDEVMATLEKLGELKTKGILTEDEFATKKAELLKKLV